MESLFLMKTLYSNPYFPLFNQSSYLFVDWFKIIVSSRERLFYCFFFLTFGIHCDGIKLIILPSSVNHRFSCALSWQNKIWITFFGWKTNLTISSKMLFIRRDFVGQTIYRAQHCVEVNFIKTGYFNNFCLSFFLIFHIIFFCCG